MTNDGDAQLENERRGIEIDELRRHGLWQVTRVWQATRPRPVARKPEPPRRWTQEEIDRYF